MKKTILLLLPLLMIAISCATEMKAVNEDMRIQRVVTATGDQDELFRLSNEWMAKTFRESSEVIQYQDKEEGVIVGKGFTKSKVGLANFNFWFTMTIESKDQKARVTIEDVYGEDTIIDTTLTVTSAQLRDKEYAELRAKFDGFIDDYAQYVRSGVDAW